MTYGLLVTCKLPEQTMWCFIDNEKLVCITTTGVLHNQALHLTNIQTSKHSTSHVFVVSDPLLLQTNHGLELRPKRGFAQAELGIMPAVDIYANRVMCIQIFDGYACIRFCNTK